MQITMGIASLIFRRGSGILKFIFAIDDSIRLFTITLVFFLGLSLLQMSQTVIIAGTVLGFIIDVHDIFDDLRSGNPPDVGL